MTDSHGYYNKFTVARVDRSDGPGDKHDGCDYFVLDLTHDPAARRAVLAYADACEVQRPQLAAELRERWSEDGPHRRAS